MAAERVKVLCIGGTGQNGSTLLSRMLGRIPGYVAVGEVAYLWDKGLVENVECGCGARFRDCPFWTRVGEEAFGGWDKVDHFEALRLRGAIKLRGIPSAHPLSLPLILFPSLWPRYRRDLRRYSELMRRLYLGIHRACGGRIIVDSMKRPSHVYAMRRLPGMDFALLHLVRDSRGVAYSSLRWVRRQGIHPRTFRTRRPPWKTAARWMWINLAFQALPRFRVPSVLVRYERFVTRPKEELERVAALHGRRLTVDDLAFIHDDLVDLPPDHLVAGNRVRLHTGPLRLKLDDEWSRKLTPRERRTVSSVTWPLLRRYGYLEDAEHSASSTRPRRPAESASR
jgi:hypothetical protein